MQVNDILTLARAETHTTSDQYSDSTLIGWLNIVYKKMVRKIMSEVDENYFIATKTLQATTADSYALETLFAQLKSLKLKYGSNTSYVQSREFDFSAQTNDFEYYATAQPTSSPVHQIVGTSLFIAPRFTSATISGTNQIVYTYEPAQADLVVGGAESTIMIPSDFHYVMVLGLKPMIYAGEGKTEERNNARAEFLDEQDEMLYLMRGRDNTYNQISVPNDLLLQ